MDRIRAITPEMLPEIARDLERRLPALLASVEAIRQAKRVRRELLYREITI